MNFLVSSICLVGHLVYCYIMKQDVTVVPSDLPDKLMKPVLFILNNFPGRRDNHYFLTGQNFQCSLIKCSVSFFQPKFCFFSMRELKTSSLNIFAPSPENFQYTEFCSSQIFRKIYQTCNLKDSINWGSNLIRLGFEFGFLSDPGKPGVQSLGPDVCLSKTFCILY